MSSSTIEPRLIALLNDAASESHPASPSLELPPLHDPNILKASGRPLVLEPDTSKRNGKPTPNTALTPHHPGLVPALNEDDNIHRARASRKKPAGAVDRALAGSPLQSIRKILDNNTAGGSPPSPSSKKRNMGEINMDDFVQLPQPPKKQKATKQVVPPIIIGLFEPPPQSTLFPPIASNTFHDSQSRNGFNTVRTTAREQEDSAKLGSSSTNTNESNAEAKKPHKKPVKARKKWTEEETNNLLLGVHKHGVGRWTEILEDRDFWFNGRSGVDLKDRFRTCCPNELRGKALKSKKPASGSESATSGLNQRNSTSSLMAQNISTEKDETNEDNDSAAVSKSGKLRKTRAHRKRLEDLAELGIEGPFRESQRRERRPFSDQDDREILLGYSIYGPAWTRIQRDPRFHLQSRQPTDLRDRFRNKCPERFRPDEAPPKENHQSDVGEVGDPIATQPTPISQPPSSDGSRVYHRMASEKERPFHVTQLPHPQTSGYEIRDSFSEQPTEPTEGLPSFDWNASAPFTGNMGEMDISRLLLDESWIDTPSSKEKQTFTDINSIISSNSDAHVPSFYNMLLNDDQINLSSSVTLDHDSSFG